MSTKKIFAANALTGGAAGALDDIDHNSCTDEDLAVVIDSGNSKTYLFWFDDDNGGAESSPDIIEPDSAAAAGSNHRWVLCDNQSFTSSFMRTLVTTATTAAFLAALDLEYDHIWIGATAMTPTTTNGAESTSGEEWDNSTNDNMRAYLAFDKDTDEYACFDVVMPSAWDRGTIKFKPYYTGLTGVSSGETAVFALQGVALGNNEDLDADQGTAQTSSDTLLDDDSDKLHIGPASSAITIADESGGSTVALGDLVHFKLYRDVSADNAGGDLALFGIVIEIKYDQTVSAW